jgi:hypothetical protein
MYISPLYSYLGKRVRSRIRRARKKVVSSIEKRVSRQILEEEDAVADGRCVEARVALKERLSE